MRNRATRLLGIVFMASLSAVSTGCTDIEDPLSSSGSGAGGGDGTSTSTGQGGQKDNDIGPINGNVWGDEPTAGGEFVGASGAWHRYAGKLTRISGSYYGAYAPTTSSLWLAGEHL